MSYATDKICHNSAPGTYMHECGKQAEWLATFPTGFQMGVCSHCKEHGYEVRPSTGAKFTKL